MVTKKTQETNTVAADALVRAISKDQFAGIGSFDDALALALDIYGELVTSDQLGDGFKLLDNKDLLVGVPFIVLDTSIVESDKFSRNGEAATFVTMRVVTDRGDKYVVVDGGTGICEQVKEWRTKFNKRGGLVCRRGLSKSEYDYTDDKGNTSLAATYYIDEQGA